MTVRNKPTPEQLQGMIYQAYEEIPHADAHRLEAIGARVRPSKAISCRRRSQTPWWMIGLVLMASGAAAWWGMHSNTEQDSIDNQTESLISDLPAASPQAFDVIPLHQSLPAEAHENESGRPSDSDQKLSQSNADKEGSAPKNSNIIFQRETF